MDDNKITIGDIEKITKCATDWWVNKISGNKISQEALQRFADVLASHINVGLARTDFVSLTTDYYPEALLAKAVHEASIPNTVFPKRTSMDISTKEVGVRENHANRQVLFTAPKKTKLALNNNEAENTDVIENATAPLSVGD